jgi:patatin-like phospholipase/acyl hydrolase
MAYCILSLDGGGIRGLYTAVLLDRLVREFPELIPRTQLIAGTSTGGIISLGLASGLQTRDLIDLYEKNGSTIFQTTWLRRLLHLFGLIRPDYKNANLKNLLQQKLGDKILNELGKKVLIPSFDMDCGQDNPPGSPRTWKPKFFHNYPGSDSDGAEKVVDVALRTSAAPIYFPEYQHYIDGGTVANNPSMAALAQAIDPQTGNQKLDNLRIFSVGTGTRLTYTPGANHNWGLFSWARPLVSLLIDGVMGVADYQCQRLLGESRYFRLAPNLQRDIAIDAVSKIPELIEDANNVEIGPAVEWLVKNYK